MALCEVRLSAQNALQRMTSFMAILPEHKPGPFPVLYLLHGLSDDHTAWVRRTSIERYVSDIPLIVVMPDGQRSWYTDAVSIPTFAFETFIVRDLISFVDTTFPTKASREGRAIAGLSMGGYGAFKLALKHPDMFCAAASLSGALYVGNRFDVNDVRDREMRLIFGDSVPQDEDISHLVRNLEPDKQPALWFDCGTEDFLIEDNRAFHKLLQDLGVPHCYSERPGTHSWSHWDAVIQEALDFIRSKLGI
ncbi:MAG: alpha/beta hydrolase family protein [Armatimonadota bacterium]|nr:alpha/beta hydrolase family protein [Armatimonadota bacterium]